MLSLEIKSEFEEQIEIFSYLIVEEFLMKKNLLKTLTTFRNEWNTRPDDVN